MAMLVPDRKPVVPKSEDQLKAMRQALREMKLNRAAIAAIEAADAEIDRQRRK
jgi:hypothetical protein